MLDNVRRPLRTSRAALRGLAFRYTSTHGFDSWVHVRRMTNVPGLLPSLAVAAAQARGIEGGNPRRAAALEAGHDLAQVTRV